MALNSSGPISLAGATAGQSIALELTLGATSQISLNDTVVRTLAGVPSGAISMPANFWGKSNLPATTTKLAFIMAGSSGTINARAYFTLVNNLGNLISDTVTGTPRYDNAASTYGLDKGIMYGGVTTGTVRLNTYVLMDSAGVLGGNTASSASVRHTHKGALYGSTYTTAIFAFGRSGSTASTNLTTKNLVSNTGVLAADSAGAGTPRIYPSCTQFGTTGTAIFVFGNISTGNVSISNLVSNVGVISSDTATGASIGQAGCGAPYGSSGQAFVCWQNALNAVNYISNTGVLAAAVTSVGSPRMGSMGGRYGNDKALLGYGGSIAQQAFWNRVSNTGVISADVASATTARQYGAAAGYSTV